MSDAVALAHSENPQLVLASSSPRRRDLLAGLQVRFSCRPVDVDETPLPNEMPTAYVERLARAKAHAAVTVDGSRNELIVAADTVVVLDGDLLGKPTDTRDAVAMLARIAGRQHEVLTGLAVHAASAPMLVEVERSLVRIAALSDRQIGWYVGTGEPLDKAGAYAIQGLGALFVESVEGNYSNVVGLPLPLLNRMLGSLGYDLRSFRDPQSVGI